MTPNKLKKVKQKHIGAEKMVKVVWRDIASVTSADNSWAWANKEKGMEEAEKLWLNEYTTIGELMGETENYVVIAGTSDNCPPAEDTLYSDMSMIPKSVIIRIEKLKSS